MNRDRRGTVMFMVVGIVAILSILAVINGFAIRHLHSELRRLDAAQRIRAARGPDPAHAPVQADPAQDPGDHHPRP